MGYAIIFESIRTICTIYPSSELLADAAGAVQKFLQSDNHNMKYLGVTALAAITKIEAQYAVQHQLTVIDCLESNDTTLQQNTFSY